MVPYYTPLRPMPNIPVGEHYGAFGVARKYAHHCGVDLHCVEGSTIYSVEDGVITDLSQFTGAEVQSPWWLPTWQVSIQGDTGVIVYGEIAQNTTLQLGMAVQRGRALGQVKRVLRHDKGKPLSMLHFMLLKHGFKDGDIPSWELGKPRPEGLLDPTNILLQCSINDVLSTTWR